MKFNKKAIIVNTMSTKIVEKQQFYTASNSGLKELYYEQ